MRISDWSSDVCSSDLDRAIISTIGGREADARSHIHVVLGALEHFWLRREYRSVREQATGLLLRRLIADRQDCRAILNTLLGVLNEHTDVYVYVTQRSEEHTSELQSLMRISYAVFCLKKKTHTHTATH